MKSFLDTLIALAVCGLGYQFGKPKRRAAVSDDGLKLNDNPLHHNGRMTARDLLVKVGGPEHALCSVIAKTTYINMIKFKCTCNATHHVARSGGEQKKRKGEDPESQALRHVTEKEIR